MVFFFENQWSRWKFFRKCALLLHWWPIIAAKIKRAKAGSFWHIPSSWPEKGKLRAISNEDPRQLRIERKHAARRGKKSKAVAVRPPSTSSSIGPLFEYVEAKNEIENARKKSNSTADKTDERRDDEEQSRLFIKKAREIGANEENSRADELIGRLAKKPPEPRKSKK